MPSKFFGVDSSVGLNAGSYRFGPEVKLGFRAGKRKKKGPPKNVLVPREKALRKSLRTTREVQSIHTHKLNLMEAVNTIRTQGGPNERPLRVTVATTDRKNRAKKAAVGGLLGAGAGATAGFEYGGRVAQAKIDRKVRARTGTPYRTSYRKIGPLEVETGSVFTTQGRKELTKKASGVKGVPKKKGHGFIAAPRGAGSNKPITNKSGKVVMMRKQPQFDRREDGTAFTRAAAGEKSAHSGRGRKRRPTKKPRLDRYKRLRQFGGKQFGRRIIGTAPAGALIGLPIGALGGALLSRE